MRRAPGAGRSRPAGWAVFAVLAAIVAGIYGQTASFGYVFDDYACLLGSPQIREGITPATVRWALTSGEFCNWFPATRFSWLADAELFGMDPGAAHLVNAMIHLASAWCLFALLANLSGARTGSAAVAALWAAHPLQVEVVAWITERSMLLATFFAWLAVGAYVAYVRRPSAWRYQLVLLAALLSFLAKPIVVTLPALLLLLDWWPLGRLRGASGAQVRFVLLEKLPLAVLGATFGLKAILLQMGSGTMAPLERLPLLARAGVTARALGWHVAESAWPSALGVYYPLAGAAPEGQTATAVVILAAVSFAAALTWRHRPQALVGWVWFLATLLPVSGVFQAGGQATADRFSYVPLGGLLVMAAGWVPRRPFRTARTVLAATLAATLGAAAFAQAGYWRDEMTLFSRACATGGGGSWIVRHRLAMAHEESGDLEGALPHHRAALRLAPQLPRTHNALGAALAQKGDFATARRLYEGAERLSPGNGESQAGLADLGRCEADAQPAACFERAVRARRLASPF